MVMSPLMRYQQYYSAAAGCQQNLANCENLLWRGRNSIVLTARTTEEHCAGCSKRPDFSPAHPWRAETRLVPNKAAASEEARRTLRYVELLSEARTKLADVFSILLKIRLDAGRGLIEDRCGGAREGFVVRVVEGIDAELDQAGRQQIEEFF